MRVIIFFILLFGSTLLGAQSAMDKEMDFKIKDGSLSDAILLLSEQSGIPISFGNHLLTSEKKISLDVKQKSISEILQQCIEPFELSYKLRNDRIILFKKPKRKFRISGSIQDVLSGEKLIAATVWKVGSSQGVSSNNYGFFSFELEEGEHDIAISYLGYQTIEQKIKLTSNKTITFSLEPSVTLAEVVVYAYDSISRNRAFRFQENQLSLNHLELSPKLGGETDLIRLAAQMPGVNTGTDGLGGLNIRGGSADQNLVLLDGIPVYNPTHTLGLLSIFNPSTIRNATLIKGGFPARFSGRLSSVLDVRTKEGNLEAYEAEASVGLIASRFTLQGPIKKGRSGFLVSFRRTHLDPLIKNQTSFYFEDEEIEEEGGSNYFLYDFNLKYHFGGKKNRFYFSYYKGRDRFFDEELYMTENEFLNFQNQFYTNIDWGNTIGAIRWNHIFGDRLFSNTSFTYSRYNYRNTFAESTFLFVEDEENEDPVESNILNSQSDIEDIGVRIDFDFAANNEHQLKFGSQFLYRNFRPSTYLYEDFFEANTEEEFESLVDSLDSFFGLEDIFAQEWSLYFEDEWTVNPKLKLNIGLNLSNFFVEEVSYHFLEPRFNLLYQHNEKSHFNLSAGRMTQYLHVLSTAFAGLPNDLWLPSTDIIPPQIAWNQIARYRFNTAFPSLGEITLDENWEYTITQGIGWSYGLETMLRKDAGNLQAWLSYTLSWAHRQFEEVNNGEVFPFNFDRRHQLHLNLNYKFNTSWSLSANWNFGTGQPTTFIETSFEFIPSDFLYTPSDVQLGTLNADRLPNYHRLDLSVNYKTGNPKWKHHFSLSFFNVYNRKNPFFRYKLSDGYNPSTEVQLNLLPFVPGLNYTLQFHSRPQND